MNNAEHYKKKVAEIRSSRDKAVEKIQKNDALTDVAKTIQIREIRQTAEYDVRPLKEQLKEEKVKRIDELFDRFVKPVYSTNDSETDKLTKQSLYRQAIEKAEKTADGSELQSLLMTAKQTDDQLLQQAIGYVAFETGWFDEARAALADTPARVKQFDELISLKTSLENPNYEDMMTEGIIFAL
jgi:hypothetical protein